MIVMYYRGEVINFVHFRKPMISENYLHFIKVHSFRAPVFIWLDTLTQNSD